MSVDLSPIVNQITVTRDTAGNYLYNEEPSLFKLLGSMPGVKEVWDTMTDPQKCAFTAEIHIALGINPDTVVADGMIFGVYTWYHEGRDDWLVEVIDPRDDSQIYVDWLSQLRKSNIMENEHDVQGLRKFLLLIGEIFEEDLLVDISDPKFTGRVP